LEDKGSQQSSRPTPACAITSLVLLIISLVTPQIIAPLLLIIAIITGIIGSYRKEWGGVLPLITSILSILFLIIVIYNLHTLSTKVSEALSGFQKSDGSSKFDNPFGENDNTYSQYIDLQDIKGNTSYGQVTLKGRIKNNGSKKIKNCTLKVIIYDKKENILHTDKIHVFGDVDPGESKSFQSMTLWPKGANTFNLRIDELRVK
jgi:energy-coupling factor transporter transmembrane protein EcfT